MTQNHVSRTRHMAGRAQHHAHTELNMAQRRLAKLREEAKSRGEAMIDEFKDRGGELLEEAQDRGRRAVRSSGEWIGENPVQAVGFAFIAGMILRGWLSRREA